MKKKYRLFAQIDFLAKLYFTVTNDLSFDQRMIRICSSLSHAGYDITLVGRKLKNSVPLQTHPFKQKRLFCFFTRGKAFYAEYNIRLFIFLFFRKMDGICAIDLDTILPCLYISRIKKIKRIYDAHELFCEMKEIVSRPSIYNFWKKIEQRTVPHFANGYTVNQQIADALHKMYNVRYELIRNIARHENFEPETTENYLLYQGAVNEGRAFETLIPAMKKIDMPLWIVGTGNFLEQAKALVAEHKLEHKVFFKGNFLPNDLKKITRRAFAGFTLFDKDAESNYHSLANRFFDYMQAGIPQICVNYPVYAELNNLHDFAVMIENVETDTIVQAVNMLKEDPQLWSRLQHHAREAALTLNWQNEQLKLVAFYRRIFG